MKGKWFWVVLIMISIAILTEIETSATVIIGQDNDKFDIHQSMEILEDKEGNLLIDEIASQELSQYFKLNNEGIPSYGYKKSVYWVKFKINNPTKTEKYILEIPYAPHDSIIFYEPKKGNGYRVKYGGDLLPFAQRDRNHRHVTFDLFLPQSETHTFYIRFQSEGSLQLPITLWKENAFSEKSVKEYLLFGIYFGITIAMIIYNLLLYMSLRLHSYLWYVILIIGFSMTQLAFNGIAYQFYWPESPWWNNRSIVFSLAVTCAAGALFVSKFLDLQSYAKRWSTLLNIYAAINLSLLGILMISYQLSLYLIMISINIFVILIFTTTIWSWKKGNAAARYLFLGWFILLLSGLITSLSVMGVLPVNFFTKYVSMMGSVVEMILFSLALAARMKLFKTEKEKAEKMVVEQLKKVERLKHDKLEERVKIRTKELEIKTEKLLKVETSRRRLLSNISHDIGTPMTSIQGYVKAMMDGVIQPSNEKYLRIIYEKTLFIERLIQDLHDLAKLETGEVNFYMEPVNIRKFLTKFLAEFEMDIRTNNIEFTLNVHPSLKEDKYSLYIDPDRIRQVMENLISNAIKYTHTSGTITIEAILYDDFIVIHPANQEYLDEIAVALEKIVKNHPEPTIVIGVHDNGKGIDSQSLPFIFDRFYRADSEKYDSFRNEGLGLAIAKEIINYHEGIIWAESIKTKGSSFYFTLPIYLNNKEEGN